MNHPLDPDIQEILSAYGNCIGGIDAIMGSERHGLAAAFRAAADQVVPEHREHHPNTLDERYRKVSVFDIRNKMLAIAAELEKL